MTKIDAEWWRDVASKNRRELLDDLVLAVEAIDDAEEALRVLNRREKLRESVVIACTRAEAELSLKRLGLNPRDPNISIVTTTEYAPDQKIRGRMLENDHILMVPGWARGKNADRLKDTLAASGANWQFCRYAPSPETDRAEGLSNWGRTETAIVDDMLETVQ